MALSCHPTAEGASVGKAMKNIQAHVKDLWRGFGIILCALGYPNRVVIQNGAETYWWLIYMIYNIYT